MSGMAEHDRIAELVPLVALGAATPDEVAEVHAHAASCPVCRAELDSLAVAASRIGMSVPQVAPPPRLKAELMEAIRADSRGAAAPAATPRPIRRRLWPSLAGALAAAVIGLTAWNVTLQRDRNDTTALTPVQVAPNVTVQAQLATVNGRRVAVMNVAGLAALDPAQGYEVWVVPASGVPESRGFMALSAANRFSATVDVSAGETIAVTRETRTNTTAPTTDKVLVITT